MALNKKQEISFNKMGSFKFEEFFQDDFDLELDPEEAAEEFFVPKGKKKRKPRELVNKKNKYSEGWDN